MVFDQAEAVLEAAGQQIASLYGESYQVLRPDYTQTSSPEAVVYPLINFRLDPESSFVEPKVEGVDYYQIVGTRRIQVGDVLVAQNDNTGPTMTIVSGGRGKPFYGAYTNLTGHITNGADDGSGVLYSNVRFKLFTLPSVSGGLDSSLLGSLGAATQRVLLYNGRPGLEQGMWLRWSDPGLIGSGNTIQKAVRIDSVTSRINQLVLNVSDNPGR